MYWYPKLQEYDLTLITCQKIKISFLIRKTAKQKYLPQENYFSSKTQTGEEGTIQQAISIISQQSDKYHQYYNAKKKC